MRDNLIKLINDSYKDKGIWESTISDTSKHYIAELEIIEKEKTIYFTCILLYELDRLEIVNLTFYPNNANRSKTEINNKKYGGRIK